MHKPRQSSWSRSAAVRNLDVTTAFIGLFNLKPLSKIKPFFPRAKTICQREDMPPNQRPKKLSFEFFIMTSIDYIWNLFKPILLKYLYFVFLLLLCCFILLNCTALWSVFVVFMCDKNRHIVLQIFSIL